MPPLTKSKHSASKTPASTNNKLLLAAVWYGSGADLLQGGIIAIGAPITQSHNSHNSHNSHIKRRPLDFANRSGYTEFGCQKSPPGYAVLFYGNRGRTVPLNKYSAFFEKEMGGSGGRGKSFFPVKKSFSSSPRFPSPLIHKPEHGFEQSCGVGRTAGDVEIGFKDFFNTAASFRGVGVDAA